MSNAYLERSQNRRRKMLNAHIEMDLNDHVSVVSAKIIDLIETSESLILETLMKKFLKKYELYTPDQFMDGITFLFSIDCLKVDGFKVVLKSV